MAEVCSLHKALGSVPTASMGYGEHTYNPSSKEMEAGESEVQGHFWAHGKFEAAKGYMKPHPVSLPIPGKKKKNFISK